VIEWVLLAGGLTAAWLWYASMAARERAVVAGREVCEREGLQLLDDTVALRHMRVRRDALGRLAILRRYAFEFSDTGNNRREGEIEMLGLRILDLRLAPYRIAPPRADVTVGPWSP
jgi:Protein of unknown function (DUF3301)